MSIPELAPSVEPMTAKLRELLARARQIKPVDTIEPPLPVSEFSGEEQHLLEDNNGERRRPPNAVFETAARSLLYEIVASTPISDPGFVDVWNLLDIVQICGDHDLCDPALAFWLVEELLDSQSIDGCRRVFDWLESRRERLVAKDFNQNKNLIVLRSCNELLRRLSRAEDAVFCGRVFIFLFQSFPLGDKSSVNLRGEFHVENVTTFEESAKPSEEAAEEMDIDSGADGAKKDGETDQMKPEGEATIKSTRKTQSAAKETPKGTSRGEEDAPDTDSLYPIFWTLQQSFSNPLRLLDETYFKDLKTGLDMTIKTFKKVPKILQTKQDDGKRGVKRKHGESHDQFASNFNPKYLTSRDLFKLELSDLAFQRHILVQALILIDFILSLTERSKKKLYKPNTQKALQYGYTLSEADAEWALGMKSTISNYLQEGPEGKFYYRMVDTVLSRDKNWVRWKMENCPPIARQPIATTDYSAAQSGSKAAYTNRRLRPTPLGALDLNFLADTHDASGAEILKNQERYTAPSAESLWQKIEADDLDMDFANTDEEKEQLQESKASKTWRALRLASRHRLDRFEKIDVDGKNLKRLFEQEVIEEGSGAGKDADSGVTASNTTAGTDAAANTAEAEGRGPGSVPEQPGKQDERADHTEPTMPSTAVS